MSYLFGGTPFDGYDAGGRRSLNGGGSGGGGGGQQTSTQTSYQTNIPAYLEDPTKRLVARGETLSEQAYTPYAGTRVAGFTPEQTAAFTELGGLGTPSQFGGAGSAITGAQTFGTAGALGAMGYGAGAVSPDALRYFSMAEPEAFGAETAKAYMSPYQQAVTDIAKREAAAEAAGLNKQLAGQAAKAGAFGGSRFGVEQALLGSKLATNLSDIQTKGSQEAFLNAQQQFERDRAARMQAGQQNLQAALGVQSLGAQQSLEAQKLNEANRLAAAQLNLQGAQFGTETGLKSAAQLAQLGSAEQDAALKRISAQQAAGAQQQALEQQKLDTAYQQAIEQRDWEKNQLGFLSGLIRGTPFSTQQLQSTSAPGATTASQLASIGLGAYGLSSLLGKKEGGAIKGYAKGGNVEGYAYGGNIKGLTDQQLMDAKNGKSDLITPEDAVRELNRRASLRTAVQGVRAEEELAGGLAALPADNMEFADGGIIGYDDGGGVKLPAGYDPAVYEMFLDPTSGEVYPRKKMAGAYAYGQNLRAKAMGVPSPVPVEAVAPVVAPAASVAKKDEAPTVASAVGPARAPRVVQPTAPVVAEETEPSWMKDIRARWTKSDESTAAMADEIAKGQKDVDAIRGDVKGIAALRAAAAIAQGGPGGTLAQLGRGAGAFGEEAQRGINLMQSARQGLMGQRIQLAQLERQAAQGDVNAMLVLREMGLKEPLYKAQAEQARAYAGYLSERDRGGASGGSGLAGTRLYAQQLDKAIKDFGIPTTAADKLRLADLKRQRDALLSQLTPGGAGSSVSTLPKGAIVAND